MRKKGQWHPKTYRDAAGSWWTCERLTKAGRECCGIDHASWTSASFHSEGMNKDRRSAPKRIEIVWLVEWQYKSNGDAEPGWPGKWEPDHNSGIWFTREGAEAKKRERIKDLGPAARPYRYRVAPWVRGGRQDEASAYGSTKPATRSAGSTATRRTATTSSGTGRRPTTRGTSRGA